MSENRREFFRVNFDEFIDGEILIEGQGSLPVKIENISAGGLVFFSSADIQMNEKLECAFTILESPFLIAGSIVRKSRNSSLIEYGVGFTVDQGTSSELFKELNYYQIRLRKGTLVEE